MVSQQIQLLQRRVRTKDAPLTANELVATYIHKPVWYLPCQKFATGDPCRRVLYRVSNAPWTTHGHVHDCRSLVLSEEGFSTVCAYESKDGSAQSSRWFINPGISEIKENCIMHSRSHREPKKSIWLWSDESRSLVSAGKTDLWL